jgi:hypothetical protein
MNIEFDSSYEPAERDQTEQQKKFRIEKAQDKDTQTILRARQQALEDPELTNGASKLFAYLLDLSLNPNVNIGRRGQIGISTQQLSQRLHASRRAVYGWVRQLIAQRYVWLSKLARPNTNALNVYHIAALQPLRELRLELGGEPLWGNGHRRPVQAMPKGARGGLGKNGHVLVDRFGHPLFSQPAQYQPSDPQKLPVPPAKFAGAMSTNCAGLPQNLREPGAEIAHASRKKEHVAPAKIAGPPAQKAAPLRESQDGDQRPLENSLNVQRVNAFKKGGEDGFLIEAARVLAGFDRTWAKMEMENSGAWWRMKFRQDPDKAARVLAEIHRMIKEGVAFTENPGAAAVDLWKRFA